MLDAASRCVRCGYETREIAGDDFPARRALYQREGLAYSSFAQLSLEVWAILAVLGIVVAFVVAVLALTEGEWLRLFLALLSAWADFALWTLLRRAADNS